MDNHTPAFRLLCACCRWPPSESKHVALATAAADVDWVHFCDLVKRHRVAGLVYHALSTTSVSVSVPEKISVGFAANARSIAKKGLAQLHETARLQRLLLADGVDTRVVKGASLGLKVYGSVALKESIDIDLVTRPGQVGTALQILQDDGYQLMLPFSPISRSQMPAVLRYLKEMGLKSKSGHFVDIHWGLVDNPALLDETAVDWKGALIPITPSIALRTLCDDDLFAYLCGHGAAHHWMRLKWLADLNALLTQNPPEVRKSFNARVATLGTLWPAVEAQLLCQKLLGTPLDSTLMKYKDSGRAKRLTTYALNRMCSLKEYPDRGPAVAMGEYLILAQLGGGLRFWRGHLKAYLVQPTVIEKLKLPGRLTFLYPFIRPFFWIWFRWFSSRGRYRWDRKSVDTAT